MAATCASCRARICGARSASSCRNRSYSAALFGKTSSTAGRTPKDEAHIRELRTMLAAADADEIHLVLSSVTSSDALQRLKQDAELAARIRDGILERLRT